MAPCALVLLLVILTHGTEAMNLTMRSVASFSPSPSSSSFAYLGYASSTSNVANLLVRPSDAVLPSVACGTIELALNLSSTLTQTFVGNGNCSGTVTVAIHRLLVPFSSTSATWNTSNGTAAWSGTFGAPGGSYDPSAIIGVLRGSPRGENFTATKAQPARTGTRLIQAMAALAGAGTCMAAR